VRGDDVFTPTDILIDIWHSINGADFVIADITGRNPNVLYELGIAHTLAKPVLILSRNAADIPIDLSTRRVILYGQSGGDWMADLDAKVSRAIGEILTTYNLRPSTAASAAEPRASVAASPAIAEPVNAPVNGQQSSELRAPVEAGRT
jgi:nucleoside 2-deoxyribosyltransferase